MIVLMTPTEHEKREWSRLAQAAYFAGHNRVGHRYSAAASLCRNCDMDTAQFDSLMNGYRAWLIGGFETPDIRKRTNDKARADYRVSNFYAADGVQLYKDGSIL